MVSNLTFQIQLGPLHNGYCDDDLEVDATRVSFQLMPGLPSSFSAVVPGLHLQIQSGNCPGGGGGGVKGGLGDDVAALRDAIIAGPVPVSPSCGAAVADDGEKHNNKDGGDDGAAAAAGLGTDGSGSGSGSGSGGGGGCRRGSVRWRALLVDGSVEPLEDRSYTMVVDYDGKREGAADDGGGIGGGGVGGGGGLGFHSEADEREQYAARVVDAVNYAGGADVIIASGSFDAVVARALRERAGVAAVLCSVGRRDVANAAALAGVRPVMDIEQVIASDISGRVVNHSFTPPQLSAAV